MQPDELLRGLPGYPVTGWVVVCLIAAAAVVRAWQSRPQKQRDTNARFGQRLETVEIDLRFERTRRIQVEHELSRAGFILPDWPDDPPLPPARPLVDERDVDEHLVDGYPETEQRVSVPPLPEFPRHRRRTQ